MVFECIKCHKMVMRTRDGLCPECYEKMINENNKQLTKEEVEKIIDSKVQTEEKANSIVEIVNDKLQAFSTALTQAQDKISKLNTKVNNLERIVNSHDIKLKRGQ